MNKTPLIAAIAGLGAVISLPSFAQDVEVEVISRTAAPSESRTSTITYNVKARGGRNDSRSEVYDDALYKAARLTLRADYDWFRVIDSDVERKTERVNSSSEIGAGYERVPYRSCGLLACRTEYRTERRSSVNININDREETRYTVELEFQVGWGEMPLTRDVFDARRVKRTYR